jgi:hypothetical protein
VLTAAGTGLTGVVSTEVIALAEGVMKTMMVTKVKVAAAVVLGLALLGSGGGVLTYRTVAGEPDGATQKAPAVAQTGGRAAAANEEKLKELLAQKEQQLAQKEREVSDLKARMAALEDQLRDRVRQLEATLEDGRRAQAAEQDARRRAEVERDARVAAAEEARRFAAGEGNGASREDPRRAPAPDMARAAQADLARDEVELLEVQLLAKQAELNAAGRVLKATTQVAEQTGLGEKARIELATLAGQEDVKKAAVREAEVRLTQAKRRLAKLQGLAEPAPDARGQQLGQRAADLEKRLDALKKELDGLRKEMEQKRPARP